MGLFEGFLSFRIHQLWGPVRSHWESIMNEKTKDNEFALMKVITQYLTYPLNNDKKFKLYPIGKGYVTRNYYTEKNNTQ